MAGSSNAFIGLDVATLQTLQTAYIAALVALASNSSYSLNGRALTRSNLTEVRTTLGEINAALSDANGTATDRALVSFTGL
jgi:hypothetical protein